MKNLSMTNIKKPPIRRVAIIIDTLNGGGAEKVCLTLFEGLKNRKGVEPHLIVFKPHCEYELNNLTNVHFLFSSKKVRLYGKYNQSFGAQRLGEIQKHVGNFDLCLTNLELTYEIVAKSVLQNCYYVIHNSIEKTLSNNWRLGPVKYLRKKRAIKALDGKNLITVSNGIKNEILSGKMIKPKSVRTIYNPFDLELIETKSLEADDGIPTRPYIIFVGRIARQKRLDILFKSFQLVKSDVDLVVLTNNLGKLEKYRKKYNNGHKNIIGLEFRQNPFPLIRKAKALVISSDHEGLSTVLIEALACGTSVVSTNCPHGADEILTGDLERFLSPVGDYKYLAKNIDQAVDYKVETPDIFPKVELEYIISKYMELLTPII